MFCAKCKGGIMMPGKVKGQRVMQCSSCGYVEKDSKKAVIKTEAQEKKDIEVIDAEQDFETLPLIEEQCEKCDSNQARYWVVQTRSGDEAPTKFIKCEKCGHTWRDYS